MPLGAFFCAFVASPVALHLKVGTSASPVVPVNLLSFATRLPIPPDFVLSKEASKEQGVFFVRVAVGERQVF